MSAYTTADQKVESVREHINEAIKDLSEILINECYGHDDFSLEFIEKMNLTFEGLRKAQSTLGK